MLPQIFRRTGARRAAKRDFGGRKLYFSFIFGRGARTALFFALALALAGCAAKPTDLRTLAPADALVYLETNDLGQALGALTESRAFADAAKSKPDFSALRGLQTAVAVTGFEASENQVTAENSVLSFKPRFVAVADTHTWNRYARQLAEETLGNFVNETYGGEVALDAEDKAGGRSLVWTAKDGRRAFAFVAGSRVFFANDEAALEKALAVARGEAASLVGSESLARAREGAAGALAFGYVSPDGVAQAANLAGVSTAVEATDDEEGRGFIARVLPQVLRGAVREVFWTATRTEQGIEDKYAIALAPESANVFKETLVPPAPQPASDAAEYLPAELFAATRYNLQNPQIAWRSLLLVAGKNSDAVSAKVLVAYSSSLLDPYGVADAEGFLGAAAGELWTASFDAEGEKTVAVVGVKNADALKKAIAEIDFRKPPEKVDGGAELWKSDDGATAAAFLGEKLLLGDAESVAKCLEAKRAGRNFTQNPAWKRFAESGAVAVSYGRDQTEKTIAALGEKKAENIEVLTNYTAETRFNAAGVERRTVSPFGLIGRIVEQFEE